MYHITRPDDTRFAWRMFSLQGLRRCRITMYTRLDEEIKLPQRSEILIKLVQLHIDQKLFEALVRTTCIEYVDLDEIKLKYECVDIDLKKIVLLNNTVTRCNREDHVPRL